MVDSRVEQFATIALEAHALKTREGERLTEHTPELTRRAESVLPKNVTDPRDAFRAVSDEVRRRGEVHMFAPERFQEMRVKGFGAGEAAVKDDDPLNPSANKEPTNPEALRIYKEASMQIESLRIIMAAAEYYRQGRLGKGEDEAQRIAGIDLTKTPDLLDEAVDAVIDQGIFKKNLPGIHEMGPDLRRNFVRTRLLQDELFLEKMRDKMVMVEQNIATLPKVTVEAAITQKKESEAKAALSEKQLLEEVKILEKKWGRTFDVGAIDDLFQALRESGSINNPNAIGRQLQDHILQKYPELRTIHNYQLISGQLNEAKTQSTLLNRELTRATEAYDRLVNNSRKVDGERILADQVLQYRYAVAEQQKIIDAYKDIVHDFNATDPAAKAHYSELTQLLSVDNRGTLSGVLSGNINELAQANQEIGRSEKIIKAGDYRARLNGEVALLSNLHAVAGSTAWEIMEQRHEESLVGARVVQSETLEQSMRTRRKNRNESTKTTTLDLSKISADINTIMEHNDDPNIITRMILRDAGMDLKGYQDIVGDNPDTGKPYTYIDFPLNKLSQDDAKRLQELAKYKDKYVESLMSDTLSAKATKRYRNPVFRAFRKLWRTETVGKLAVARKDMRGFLDQYGGYTHSVAEYLEQAPAAQEVVKRLAGEGVTKDQDPTKWLKTVIRELNRKGKQITPEIPVTLAA